MKRVIKIGGLVFLALLLIFGATIGIQVWSGIRQAKTLAAEDISAPNLEDIPDGTWQGQVEWGMLAVTVDVTVAGGEITGIELVKHDNGRGEKAEIIIEDILAAQTLEVDTISGATLSSKAILHAIADAMNNSK